MTAPDLARLAAIRENVEEARDGWSRSVWCDDYADDVSYLLALLPEIVEPLIALSYDGAGECWCAAEARRVKAPPESESHHGFVCQRLRSLDLLRLLTDQKEGGR